jgi:dihydrofolate reductase
MRKVVFAINNTIDGYADHTAGIADDALHDFHTDLLDDCDIILFGRTTYQLMESFWPTAKNVPGITKSMIRFAEKINSIKKMVFSKNLNKVSWNNVELHSKDLFEQINQLKKQNGKNIAIGSLSLAAQCAKAGLIDEYWFVVQPIILGRGKALFKDLDLNIHLELLETKKFNSGTVALHYKNIGVL